MRTRFDSYMQKRKEKIVLVPFIGALIKCGGEHAKGLGFVTLHFRPLLNNGANFVTVLRTFYLVNGLKTCEIKRCFESQCIRPRVIAYELPEKLALHYG